MRWIAGLMLGGAALLGGCLQPGAVFCDNGAVCRAGQACTENAQSLCDTEHAVAECHGAGKSDGTMCMTEAGTSGLCTAGACAPCAPELFECRVNGWTPMQSMASDNLTAIHVAGARLVYVVGDGSTVLRYDGLAWTRIDGPTEGGAAVLLLAVWASDTEVFVLSAGGEIYRRTSTGWAKTTPGAGTFLNALWGTSHTNLFAGGYDGRLGIFDGSSWSWVFDPLGTTLDPTPPYNALWGATSTDVTAVAGGGLISHHDGSNAWSVDVTTGMDTVVFLGVHGVGAKVFAVGTRVVRSVDQLAIAELTANRTWIAQTPSSAATGALRGVVVVSPTQAYAVGTDGLVLRYDGSTWSDMPSLPTDEDLFAISALGRTLIAVGTAGTIWRYDLP